MNASGAPDVPGADSERVGALVETWAQKHRTWQHEWAARHTVDPEILYHYTDAAGALGIVERRELWASNAAFLNDSTELVYVRGVLQEVLDELAAGDEHSRAVARYGRSMLRGLSEWLYDVYVACFCENGDLLSQWRGYPRAGGGYSLGFDTRLLTQGNTACRRVIYDADDQRNIIRRLLTTIRDIRAEFGDAGATTLASFEVRIASQAFYGLAECSFCFKHPAFQEEREWRRVALCHKKGGDGSDGGPVVLMRATPTGLLPYIATELADGEAGTEQRSLSAVVIGPGRHPDLSATAAERLLRKAGYAAPNEIVRPSDVPLRV
jgi:hypothetical protein